MSSAVGADVPSDTEREESDFLLYVSRFEKRKNHLALLKSLLQIRTRNPKLKLVLVGFEVDGSLAATRTFIDKHALSDVVEIRANIADAELIHLFKTAKVVVYPSLCEGFGMPIVEALLLNPRTVFSNTTAMADFVFAKEKMFDPSDVLAMTAKIQAELDGAGTSFSDWTEQKRLIADKYTWERAARTLARIHGTLPL
jgi:glycosyltransferase involved in cell wall biosynthesis